MPALTPLQEIERDAVREVARRRGITRESLRAELEECKAMAYEQGDRNAVKMANEAIEALGFPRPTDEMPKEDAKTALYRHFDKDGALLYIGIAWNPARRTHAHANSATWMHQVVRIEIEWLPNRTAALKAETAAIKRDKPLHNVRDRPWPR